MTKQEKWWWEYPQNIRQTWDWMNVNLIDGDEMDRLLVEPQDYTYEFLSSGGGPGRIPKDYRRDPLPSW